jgi:uncharacterized repeat protein (TIGR04076 family)
MDKEESNKIEKRWRKFQNILGYTDEELALYRSNPKKVKAMEEAAKFSNYKIIIEVIESHNCAIGYKVGDQFVVDGDGSLILEESPAKICVGAVYGFKTLIDRMWQAFYDGHSEVLHDTTHCPDVGVHRGGWGEVTYRVRAVPKEK